ncbi:MAG: sigma-70 family RNA polymerase sigma factor [Planctomycetaceae bacterium]|nr:sigma-70 family RNA polymerase sigma factor [Planctomycetaceae bacterium]
MKKRKKFRRDDEDVREFSRSCMDIYLKDINGVDLLTAEKEQELAERVMLGDEEARDMLIAANLRLVVNIARKYVRKGCPLDDLVEEGNLGLIKAASRYEHNAGARFSTFASYWIHQRIRRALVNMTRTIQIPTYIAEYMTKWLREAVILEEQLQRTPRPEEIGRRIGINRNDIQKILCALNSMKTASSQETVDGNGMEFMLVDERVRTPEEIAIEKSNLEYLAKELNNLTEREAEVLRLRFGLDGKQVHTLRDVGEKLNLTRERVRQIKIEALHKLGICFEVNR